MTTGGFLFMILSVAFVVVLTALCYRWVLTMPEDDARGGA